MLYDVAHGIVMGLCDGGPFLLFLEYLLLSILWIVGIIVGKKKGSRMMRVFTWLVVLFSIMIATILVYIYYNAKGGGLSAMGLAFCCFISYYALPLFLAMAGVTLSADFLVGKRKWTVPYVLGSLFLISGDLALTVRAILGFTGTRRVDNFTAAWAVLMLIVTVYVCLYVPFAPEKSGKTEPAKGIPES